MQPGAIVFIIFWMRIRIRYPDLAMLTRYMGMAKRATIHNHPDPNHCQYIVVGRISTFRTTHIQTNTKRNIAQRIC